jgi:hypothetical protein
VTGARQDFTELIVALQAHALSHIANDPKVEAIRSDRSETATQ